MEEDWQKSKNEGLSAIMADIARLEKRVQEDPDYRRQCEEWERGQATERAAQRHKAQMNLLVERGIPAKDIPLFVNGGLSQTFALKIAEEFRKEQKRMLVLSGPRGCGKTTAAGWLISQDWSGHAAASIVNTLGPLFIDVSYLMKRNRYSAEDMRHIERSICLCIDDLGMEYADAKGNSLNVVDAVINDRYRDSLWTVITTNFSAEEFKRAYGERVADRIREVGKFVTIPNASLRSELPRPTTPRR